MGCGREACSATYSEGEEGSIFRRIPGSDNPRASHHLEIGEWNLSVE